MSNIKNTKILSKSEKRRKLIVRILAIVLAGLMILGMATYVIIFLAAEAQADTVQNDTQVICTSSLKDSGDVLVSVGLMYGDDVTTGFEVSAKNGIRLGIQTLSGDKSFEEIWSLNSNLVSVTSDANLYKSGQTYSIAGWNDIIFVGGYHIQIDCDDLTKDEFVAISNTCDLFVNGYGFYTIPAYIYTGYALRIGNFATYEEAALWLATVQEIFPTKVVSVVSPTKTAVSVVNPNTDKILFEYDCGQASVLGLAANLDENGNTYLTTPAGNNYDGVFAFKRYVNGSVDGVSLINILPIEAYIAGVLPYEISNSWPIEVQKEFAIAARSFALTHLNGKHASYGFDLCNTTCCEVYKGAGRINDSVMEAVLGTKGTVIVYDDKIVTSYYSSTVGGCTVSAADCWGSQNVPYLEAIETPWEDYLNHNNGFWMIEVSPTALLERLQKAGYNTLQGSVADVEIEELAQNSTYVKKLKVTDIYGNSITITYTDKVRTSLTPYVKSANFVVGRGSVEYTERAAKVDAPTVTAQTTSSVTEQTAPILTASGTVTQQDKSAGFAESDDIYVLSSESFERIDYLGYLNIMTSSATESFSKRNIFVATKETAEAYLGASFNEISEKVSAAESDSAESSIKTETVTSDNAETVTKIAYAEDSNNFIFVGKGWGHGVGMSQWGAYDLAVAGYTYDQIIRAYFPTVTLVNYRNTANYRQ